MNPKILMSLLGVILGVIMVGSVLAPVIQDAQHSNDKIYHNSNAPALGTVYEFEESTPETIVIAIVNSSERTISINGDIVNVAAWQPVFVSDACAIRYYSNTLTFASKEGTHTLTEAIINISQGIATFELKNGSTPITVESVPISWAYIHDGVGNYTALNNQSSTDSYWYVHKGDVYSANWIDTTQEFFSIKGDTVSISSSRGVHTAKVQFNGEYLDNGVYKLALNNTATSDYTFTVDNEGEPYTVSPFLICLPMEVIGTPDNQSGINSLYSAIVVIVLVALLASAVMIVRNRD